ncbi:RNA polymerase factor sigma-54, partial [Acinetobacter pittii]
GFLDAEIEEIILAAQQLLNEMDIEEEIEEDEVLVVLKHIQRLDPLGIGSRNLAECLKIQLEFLPKDVEYLNEAKSLLQYYELLIANDLNKLLKQT